MTNKPPAGEGPEFPPRVNILFFQDGSYAIQRGMLLGPEKEYISSEEVDVIKAEARREAFEEVIKYLEEEHTELRKYQKSEFRDGAAVAFAQTITQIRYIKAQPTKVKEEQK